MKIAIVGLGNIGVKVAANLISGGQEVAIADKTFAKAEKLAGVLGKKASALPVGEALATADVVILAVYFDAIKDLITTHRGALAGKIIVDPSNPIAPDGKGGFTKTIPEDQSSGQLIARMLPEGAELAKAFGTLSAESLSSGARRLPEHATLFFATDFPGAARVVADLIERSGSHPFPLVG